MSVVIRVVDAASQPDLHGVCILGEAKALIRISRAEETVMIDTLLEEWAHVLREESPIPYGEDAHDQMFWALLAAITKEIRGE